MSPQAGLAAEASRWVDGQAGDHLSGCNAV